MKAVILAGGLGTRISEESHLRPKPMIEIGGRPIRRQVREIDDNHGVSDFIVCFGYKGYVIENYSSDDFPHASDVTIDARANRATFRDTPAEPRHATLIDTSPDTPTSERLKRVTSYAWRT